MKGRKSFLKKLNRETLAKFIKNKAVLGGVFVNCMVFRRELQRHQGFPAFIDGKIKL